MKLYLMNKAATAQTEIITKDEIDLVFDNSRDVVRIPSVSGALLLKRLDGGFEMTYDGTHYILNHGVIRKTEVV